MTTCNQVMCSNNLDSREKTRKWILANHPDKNDGIAPINFDKILDCYKNNQFCSVKTPGKANDTIKVSKKNRAKIFSCMRKTANFSKISNYHKFDKSQFDPDKLNSELYSASPKIAQLLNNIENLDKQDMLNHGKHFKHFIFSDVKDGGYGAKILSSAFSSSGFNNVIKARKIQGVKMKKLYIEKSNGNKNFGLLCSNSIYGATFNERIKKELLKLFNERPGNINGAKLRFIIFDSGFKEGIDLFDVKYVHIFEPSMTIADLKQTIGRATRTCGQVGLDFKPGVGWPLYVYNYYLTVPTSTHDSFYVNQNVLKNDSKLPREDVLLFKDVERYNDATMKYSEFDSAMLNLSRQLYNLGPIFSVDYFLTKNLHNQIDLDIDFMNNDMYIMGGAKSPLKNVKKNKYYEINTINCYGKCGKKTTKDVPVSLDFMLRVYKKYKYPLKLPKTNRREFLCKYLKKTALNRFCKQLNHEWSLRYSYVPSIIEKSKKQNIKSKLQDIELEVELDDNEVDKTYQYENVDGEKQNKSIKLTTRLNFLPMRNYIKTNYQAKKYIWDKLVIENKCIKKPSTSLDNQKPLNVTELTPTQQFVKDYFTPESPYKGLLAWHSVGTGKTCTGIAAASSTFERQGYSILWVTRTTLKSDVWKNMFDQICHQTIATEVELGLTLPESLTQRKKMLSDRWLEPMSYKQFSNLLEGKNTIYNTLMQRNGPEDILHKTLIIIDEAHKLYGGDLKAAERPDMTVMERYIMNSYNKSGKDSCKLLIMTATPFTDSPIEMFKIINLFMPNESEKITTDREEFKKQYMTSENILSEAGVKNLANKMSGYISYLNREQDPTQFAQPIMINVPVLMSFIEDDDVRDFIYLNKKPDNLSKKDKDLISRLQQKVKSVKETISEKRKQLLNEKREIADECKKQFPEKEMKKDYNSCIEVGKLELEELENLIKELNIQLDNLMEQLSSIKNDNSKNKNNNADIKKKIKEIKSGLNQEYLLFKECQHITYKSNKVTKRAKSMSLNRKKSSVNVSRKIKSI
tara:strand:+ start:7460 stop:10540 length:3081 start_codon:yes stop_codon:yes gene_type:complete